MDNVANPALVSTVLRRLRSVDADAVLSTAELAAYLKTQSSPFPQVERSERPEAVSREVLNGRVAVLLDKTPSVWVHRARSRYGWPVRGSGDRSPAGPHIKAPP